MRFGSALSRGGNANSLPPDRAAVDARRGRRSVGWFYGFKLHLILNDRGELLAFCPDTGQYR